MRLLCFPSQLHLFACVSTNNQYVMHIQQANSNASQHIIQEMQIFSENIWINKHSLWHGTTITAVKYVFFHVFVIYDSILQVFAYRNHHLIDATQFFFAIVILMELKYFEWKKKRKSYATAAIVIEKYDKNRMKNSRLMLSAHVNIESTQKWNNSKFLETNGMHFGPCCIKSTTHYAGSHRISTQFMLRRKICVPTRKENLFGFERIDIEQFT